MYKAEILADSINPQKDRITTMKITFPRMMLAELNTHRMFSRNSASSRAIPFNKMVKMVEENPFIPIAWQKDHKGMQGSDYITDEKIIDFKKGVWIQARNEAINRARELNSNISIIKKGTLQEVLGTEIPKTAVTKQLCNRLLEPFMWHEVIITATEFENFFKLRCPQYDVNGNLFRSKKDALEYTATTFHEGRKQLIRYNNLGWLSINKSQADIHIQAIAELMWDAYNESKPKQLSSGEWHIPFGNNMDINLLKDEVVKHWASTDRNRVLAYAARHEYVREKEIEYYQIRQKIATARCARISYQTLGDNPKIDYEADIRLHDILAESGHWSPFEHVARAMSEKEYGMYTLTEPSYSEEFDNYVTTGVCRNFRGFIQFRSLVDNKS